MKEAIKVNLDGFYIEPTLVADSVTGVFPITELPEKESASTDFSNTEKSNEPVTVGYMVAVEVPTGLYKPRWNFDLEEWVEGLTQQEIDALHQKQQEPASTTEMIGRQLVELKLQSMQQKNEIDSLKQQLANAQTSK
ncbi:hypothetical protein [Paenibacillus agilis]|uniref:Bacteriophage SP-beta YorD domain-containing protein n=1 Tax=Paenibacillus agilis TaxID=3020863 RepID=A0A559IL21_9BACL|nr:hypothetical protein [Paenibacillus agilis]TVX88354.1 hypothetical protein FPZ44_20955 [Paenibacillus agilis]